MNPNPDGVDNHVRNVCWEGAHRVVGVGQVALVAHEHEYCAVRHVGAHFGEPVVAQVVERAAVGDVVDDHHAVRRVVVAVVDGAVALQAGCIPQLEPHAVPVQLDRFELRSAAVRPVVSDPHGPP